ncbi:CTAG/Pcc1 family [Phytophthora cactorum]|nr:CTAG/Pcc1 family [Phytophthora cactorum]
MWIPGRRKIIDGSSGFNVLAEATQQREVDALYVLQTLEVDEELQPEKIHRTLTVKGDELHVYDAFHFEATEIRLLRAAVSSFYDMSVLTARTLLEFKE